MMIYTLIKIVYLMGGFYENVQTKRKKYNKVKEFFEWEQH